MWEEMAMTLLNKELWICTLECHHLCLVAASNPKFREQKELQQYIASFLQPPPMLVAGCPSGDILGLDMRTGSNLWRTVANRGTPDSVALSPDGTNVTILAQRAFNLSAATGAVIWDIGIQSADWFISGNHVAYSPDGKQLILIAHSGGNHIDFPPRRPRRVFILEARTGVVLWNMNALNASSVLYAPDGKSWALSMNNGNSSFYVRNALSNQVLWMTSQDSSNGNMDVYPAYSPDGTRLAAFSGRYVASFQALSGIVMWEFPLDSCSILAFSPDASNLLVLTEDMTVLSLEAATGGILWERRVENQDVWWSAVHCPDGMSFSVAGEKSGSVRNFDARTGDETWDVLLGAHQQFAPLVQYSADGTALVVTMMDLHDRSKSILIVEPKTGEVRLHLPEVEIAACVPYRVSLPLAQGLDEHANQDNLDETRDSDASDQYTRNDNDEVDDRDESSGSSEDEYETMPGGSEVVQEFLSRKADEIFAQRVEAQINHESSWEMFGDDELWRLNFKKHPKGLQRSIISAKPLTRLVESLNACRLSPTLQAKALVLVHPSQYATVVKKLGERRIMHSEVYFAKSVEYLLEQALAEIPSRGLPARTRDPVCAIHSPLIVAKRRTFVSVIPRYVDYDDTQSTTDARDTCKPPRKLATARVVGLQNFV